MKALIRRLALIMSLAMLTLLIGVAEEAVTVEPGFGEVTLEDPAGMLEPELPELEDAPLSPGALEGDAGAAVEIDLPAELTEATLPAELTEATLPAGPTEAAGGGPASNAGNTAWHAIQAYIDAAQYSDGIKLDRDVVAGPDDGFLYIPAGKKIRIDLAGWTLNRGLSAPTESGLALVVYGELTVYDTVGSGMITGACNDGYGGAIFVGEGGTLNLWSGTISGNRAMGGAGIWVGTGGKCLLTGGAISNNVAEDSGGGVLATGAAGERCVEIYGCEISGNTAVYGGGVNMIDSDVTICQSEISGNTAKYGGGVFVSEGSHCTLDACSIKNNTALEEGGGVHVYGGKRDALLDSKGHACITGNKARDGGGIMCCGAHMSLYGDFVENNTSTGNGGGVLLYQARMDMYNGSVDSNTTAGEGGGVYVGPESTFSMKEASIERNVAKWGGGVDVANESQLEMQSGAIKYNTAELGGGVAVGTDAYFEFDSGFITDNTATNGDGGGVYCWWGGICEMSGSACIMGNRVNKGRVGGGGVFGGALRVSGSPYIGSNYSGTGYSDCYLGYTDDGSYCIQVVGPLYSDARIMVDYPWEGGAWAYLITAGLGAQGNLGAFSCNDYDYTVRWDYYGTEAEMVPLNAPPPQPPATPTPEPTPTPKPTPKPTAAAKVKLSKCKVSAIKDRVYTGKALRPAVTVKHGGRKLTRGTDYYILGYSKNVSVGLAKVTLRGKGRYTGTRSVTFRILPRAMAISALSAGKKKITVGWSKRAEAGGYQLQYGLKSSFSGAKTLKLKQTATKTTVKSLASGRRYYFRLRAYRTVGGKNYYGAWSKAKSVVVK